MGSQGVTCSERGWRKMVAEEKKLAEEDKELADRVTAKDELEEYCYYLKNEVDNKIGGLLSEDDKEKIVEILEEKATWLRENGDDATAEELKAQKKEVEEVAQPIIAGVYKQADESAEEHHSDDEL